MRGGAFREDGTMADDLMTGWRRWAAVAGSLIVSGAIIFYFREDYFRPYTDTLQSSLGSSDMHSVAWAATAYDSLLDFFLVTKRLTLDGSLALYPHYTNGYPLLLRAYYAAFGDGLVVSRLFPICIVAIGGTVLADKLHREWRNPLLYAALPLLFLSPIGRDAASFEFLEPAHFLVIGLSALMLYDSTVPLWARAATVVAGVVIYQVSALFMLAVVVAEYLRSRDRTAAIAMTAVLVLALLVVVAAFVEAGGVAALKVVVLHRTGLVPAYDESVSFWELRKGLATRIDWNMPPLFFFASIIEVVLLLIARRPLLPTLYLSYFVYALVLRNFVGVHYFTFLPFMFFVILALMGFAWRIPAIVRTATGRIGAWYPSAWLKPILGRAAHPATTGAAVLLFVACFAVNTGTTPRSYEIDDRPRADFDAITAYVAGHDLTRCSTFEVNGLITDQRIVAFLLARQIGRGVGDKCSISLAPQR
jgi:hypothetical protein